MTMPASKTEAYTIKKVQSKRYPFFQAKHARAYAFADRGYTHIANNLHKCEEYYRAMYCESCQGYFNAVQKCKLRICPLCAYQRRRERQEFVKLMLDGMKYPKMLTLTMKRWKYPPGEGIDFLRQSMSKLRNRKLFNLCRGGAYQIEVLLKPDGYHIHAHLILDMPYLHYRKIFAAWRDILGGYPPQVDIRAAKTAAEQNYVCKYVTKDSFKAAPGCTIVDWYEATKGKRLFGTFGKWYNAKLEDLLPEGQHKEPGMKCPICGDRGNCMPLATVVYMYKKEFAKIIMNQCPDDVPIEQRIYEDSWHPPPVQETMELPF